MKTLFGRAKTGLALLAAAWTSGGPALAAVEIAPHRAIYDMTLARSGSSDVADVRGMMEFQWADSCDGWTVTQRSKMLFLYTSGDEVELGWNLTSWESKDGLRYRFFVKKTENGEPKDEIRGEARLDRPGGPGVAEYSLPEKKTVQLPAGTLFPTAHSLKLLESAEAGSPALWAQVFDGSDEIGLFDVSAIVGRKADAAAAGAPQPSSPLLASGQAWRVGLAFYPREGKDKDTAAPEHEQSLRLHSNGIVDKLVLDYGNFSVDAELTEVEQLPPPPC